MAKVERIPVREETFERLAEFKGPYVSWDDIIWELIGARQAHHRRRLLDRTDDDEYVPLDEI